MEPQSSRENNPLPPDYLNPPVADGINNPPESQLRSFFVNLGLVGLALAALFVLLNAAANYLTPFIPFRWEKAAVGQTFLQGKLDARDKEKEQELRRIAARLAAAMDLPEGMDVAVFYSPRKMVNAFATFGGNILVFQGLLDAAGSEDELAMVLAHEIAHVKHRDAVRGIVRALGLAVLGMGFEGGMDKVTDLGLAGYSRRQEEEADLEAVGALGRVYGHAAGAREFFTTLAGKVEGREADGDAPSVPALTASHPDTLSRKKRAAAEAERLGLPPEGVLTPLPDVLDGKKLYFGDAG